MLFLFSKRKNSVTVHLSWESVVKLALVFLLSIFVIGCSSAPAKSLAKSSAKWVGYQAVGKASFYAAKYQSRKTASGERYDQRLKTAAHRKLPFGTKVKVTNVENGKSVVVKINDRGPFVKGRIIDLSRSAFSSIGDTRAGVLNVKIEVI